jgi:predicted  nucleic acid-binding Zn-ribbon protein
MADMIYLVIGAVAGLVAGGILIYLWPYQGLRIACQHLQAELTDAQAKNNELQSTLHSQQSAAYQARQALLLEQKNLESELGQAGERYAELERQRADLQAHLDRGQQTHLREANQLREVITRLEQEQVALQDRYARDSEAWSQERESLLLYSAHVDDQEQVSQREKTILDKQLEQLREAWERERLDLQIQINTLEDGLRLEKARASQPARADDARTLEQLKAEATAELSQQQAAWEAERRTLQEQLAGLQAEQQRLREQVAAAEAARSQPAGAEDQDLDALRQQLEQERQQRRTLEREMEARIHKAEQERGALETEIEQLMERLLRLHRERSS